jgi:hypothetical protein
MMMMMRKKKHDGPVLEIDAFNVQAFPEIKHQELEMTG